MHTPRDIDDDPDAKARTTNFEPGGLIGGGYSDRQPKGRVHSLHSKRWSSARSKPCDQLPRSVVPSSATGASQRQLRRARAIQCHSWQGKTQLPLLADLAHLNATIWHLQSQRLYCHLQAKLRTCHADKKINLEFALINCSEGICCLI